MELDPSAQPVGPPAFNSETFGVSAPRLANEAELVEGLDKVALDGEPENVRFGTASVDFRERYFSGFKKLGDGKGEEKKEEEKGGSA